ncbi:MAG: murein transglycosylase A [Candidatus Riflebacteria bacterium]|nr:murein transglycosylase A [Candidatus Riflebacteria bacterium]
MNVRSCFPLLVAGLAFLSAGLPAGAQTGRGYDFAGDGKRAGTVQAEAWVAESAVVRATLSSPADLVLPVRSAAAKQAARANLEVADRLAAKKTVKVGNLEVGGADLARTARAVAAWLASGRPGGAFPFRLYRSQGEDGQGNVQFTGYFTPRLEVAAAPDARFRFPLYRFPAGFPKPLPSRQEIDEGKALASRSLEIAWADDLLEVYFLQVQGSGRLHFQDGREKWIAFAGSNGIPYQSLGRMLVERGSIPADRISLRAIRAWMHAHPEDLALLNRNPSYVFFKEAKSAPVGAAGIPVIPGASVAADQRYIPPGACLLAEVPLLDPTGALLGHEWRLLFAHDTGGAIKGPGHLDLYFGLGPAAGERAGDLHHYGRIWLVLAGKPPARK